MSIGLRLVYGEMTLFAGVFALILAPEVYRPLRAVGAGVELAVVVAEKADNPSLTGPARALSRRAHNDVESGLATPPAEGAGR